MNILQALQRLRDDLKIWVTKNFEAVNEKIDKKTFPVDSRLDSSSTNPVQNKIITQAINNIPRFSGDYNDLINAPNITEDGEGAMVIVDESGNTIFKADADGIHTTTLSLNGESAATESYVDNAINAIPTPDVSGQIETHNNNENAHEDIRQAIVTAKEELSETIVSESEEWKVVDEIGNIIFQVDAGGAHTTAITLNGKVAATEDYVNTAIDNIEFPKTDLTNYATKQYVNNGIANLVNSAPEALDTLGELATALENHEDAYDALLETIGNKAAQADLTEHVNNGDIHISSTERANWNAKSDFSGDYKDLTNAPDITEDGEGNLIIADADGNIIFRSDPNGFETTTLNAQEIVLNGQDLQESLDNKQPTGDYALKSEISFMSDEEIDLICESSLAIEITSGVILKDANTGIMYKVYVEDGKLHMMEVE